MNSFSREKKNIKMKKLSDFYLPSRIRLCSLEPGPNKSKMRTKVRISIICPTSFFILRLCPTPLWLLPVSPSTSFASSTSVAPRPASAQALPYPRFGCSLFHPQLRLLPSPSSTPVPIYHSLNSGYPNLASVIHFRFSSSLIQKETNYKMWST